MIFELNSEGHYLKKARGVKENGEKVEERPARFIPDGQEHPIPGMPNLKALATRPDSNTIHGEARREDGSVVGGGTYMVSADGTTLTVTNFGWDSQLRQFQQKTVWDRVD